MIQFISGIVLGLGALVAADLLEGGNLLSLVALSPFIVTFLVPAFAMLAVWPLKSYGRAWSHAFRAAPAAEAGESIALWEFLAQASWISSILAFLMGLVLIFSTNQGDLGQFMRSLSVGLLGPLYGTGAGLAARILKARVQRLVK